MRPLDGRRVQAPPPYVADWVPVYPVGQPRTDRPPRGGSPRWCRRRLLPRAPRGGLAVMPPDAQPLPPPVGVGQQLSREVPAPVPTLLPPETHPRPRLAAGAAAAPVEDPTHPCRRRAPLSSITRSAHTGAGPTSPEVSAPPRTEPSHRNGGPRGPAPEAAPPAETGRFTTSAEPATANGGGVYPARVCVCVCVCAHDRIPPAGGHPAASSTSRVAVHRRRRHTIGDIDAEVTAKRSARLPSLIRWTRYRIVVIVHLWQSSRLG